MTESTPSTAVAKKEKTTLYERLLALAKTPEERERAFALAELHQQQQIVQELVAEVKAKAWGDKVSPALRAEIVRWTLDVGADPVTELDILGGAPYLNARYWQRLIANEPDFVRPEEVWVHVDPRATEEEEAKRRALRVQYAIPEYIAATVGLHRDQKQAAEKKPPIPVTAAVLVFLYFKERGPFVGKKWSPSRANDDVGFDHPEASALTRAWRKAALGAVRRPPPFSLKLTNLIVQGREMAKAADALPPIGAEPVAQEPVAIAPIGPPKVGVIEKHNPSAQCPIEGEHRREECGYFGAKKEPV